MHEHQIESLVGCPCIDFYSIHATMDARDSLHIGKMWGFSRLKLGGVTLPSNLRGLLMTEHQYIVIMGDCERIEEPALVSVD